MTRKRVKKRRRGRRGTHRGSKAASGATRNSLTGTWIFEWQGGGYNVVNGCKTREEALEKASKLSAKLAVNASSLRPWTAEAERLYEAMWVH